MDSKKKVVVVGGGVAGSLAAYSLQEVADVTLVDPKDYFEVPYAGARALVEPKVAERSIVLHKDYFKGTIVQDAASSATESEVTTAGGKTIPYDFLVIATGTTFHVPPSKVTKAEKVEEYKALNTKLVDAETVLIIGGGPVGVEIAGEIVTDYPKKKVTLVQSGERLIEFLGPKASKKAQKWLEGKGVKVIVDDKVDNLDSISAPDYETSKHVEIKADTHFVAIGKKVGIKWVEESAFLKEKVTVDGRVEVEATLQVVGLTKVFAAGDITSIKEMKQGYFAAKHAGVVVENIKKLIKNPEEKKLSPYKTGAAIGIVTLGRVLAVGQLPFGTILGRVPGMLKSKDLFIGQTRKQLGLKEK